VVTQASWVGSDCDCGPRRCKSAVERRTRTATRQLEERYFLPIGRKRCGFSGDGRPENLSELPMNDRRTVLLDGGGDVEQP
jgi:hypothetical protein